MLHDVEETGPSMLQNLCTNLMHYNMPVKAEVCKTESTVLLCSVLSRLALHWIDTNISEEGASSIT